MNVCINDSGHTPLVTAGEVASHALRIIHSSLRIEEDWTVRRGRGFTWWPGRLTHQVDAGPQVRDGGLALVRISSRIPVLADVLAPRHAVESALAEWNRHADSYCYVYDPEHRSVVSVQSAFTCHGVRDWHPQALGRLAFPPEAAEGL